MKKILVTVVLGVAVVAGAQDAAQPAQGQPAAPQSSSQAPVIKDPGEYNAYVAAIGQKDNGAKISGLEAFLTQYPNSIMKNQALELLMGAYQATGNTQKTLDTATKLVAADPNNVRAMTLLAYFDRMKAFGGDPNAKQLDVDAAKYGEEGLNDLPKFAKPEGTSDADFQKMKTQMTGIFQAAIGFAALQSGDDAKAVQYLKPAADANPADLSIIYPLALSYLGQKPPDYQNGIWYAARAAAIAPPANEPGLEKYAKAQYKNFHAGEDGWTEFFAAAKAGGPQVPIAPPPTPAEQAHAMAIATPPDQMDFAQWEFILSNGSQADQDMVWNAIKGKAVQLGGTVMKATATEFDIAASLDDIDAKKADLTLTFESPIPARLIPKEGASIDFQGEPSAYTPNPFMMTMEKGLLAKPKTAPKPPVRHKPAAH
ncbi:MAG TPA: hypothetical protein VIW68_02000 [Candidatus Sulfotelmatobacter sp.]